LRTTGHTAHKKTATRRPPKLKPWLYSNKGTKSYVALRTFVGIEPILVELAAYDNFRFGDLQEVGLKLGKLMVYLLQISKADI
jgi:hypothetical protein